MAHARIYHILSICSIVTNFPSNTSTPPLSFWGALITVLEDHTRTQDFERPCYILFIFSFHQHHGMELLVLGAPPLPLSPTGNKRTFKVKIPLKLVKCCVPVVSRNANCPTNFKHSLKHKLLIVLARKQISSKNCCHFHSDSVPVGMPCVFQECWINQGVLVVTASVWPFTVPLHLALPFSLFGQALFLHFYSPSFFDDEVIQSRR